MKFSKKTMAAYKKKIAWSSLEIFSDFGYQKVGLYQIAQANGIGMNDMFRCFPKKMDVAIFAIKALTASIQEGGYRANIIMSYHGISAYDNIILAPFFIMQEAEYDAHLFSATTDYMQALIQYHQSNHCDAFANTARNIGMRLFRYMVKQKGVRYESFNT